MRTSNGHVGVTAHRPGAVERAGLAMSDRHDTCQRLAVVEVRLVTVLDELGLTGLVTTIDGLTAVGAAAVAGQARQAVPASKCQR